jgi:hypothetical protein
MQMILLVGGGLVFFLLVIGAIVSMTSERSFVDERLGPYVKEEKLTRGKDKSFRSAIG